MREISNDEIKRINKMDKESIFSWMNVNRNFLTFKVKEEILQAFQGNTLVASCNIPFPTYECQTYTIQSLLTNDEIAIEIPCVAKPGDTMWYCDLKFVNDGDTYFDKNNLHQVIIDSVSGASDKTICYGAHDVEDNVFFGMQSLFHRTLQEALDFIDKANKSGEVCNFFWAYQCDFDENRKNKERFPYLLTCKYKINQEKGLQMNPNKRMKISRILFDSSTTSSVQYQVELFNKSNKQVIPNDIVKKDGREYFVDDEPLSAVVLSDDIYWKDFSFIPNN